MRRASLPLAACLLCTSPPVLAQQAAQPAASTGSRWSVLPEALPTAELLPGRGDRLRLLVVAIPFDDGDSATLAGELAPALVDRLAAHKARVESVSRIRKAADLYGLPDAELARRVLAQNKDADALVIARLYPGSTADEAPRVVLTLVDHEGEVFATTASSSAVAVRSANVNKGVQRVFEEGMGDRRSRDEGDGDLDDNGERGGRSERRAERVEAFKREALKLVPSPRDGLQIHRNGRPLGAEELAGMDAPEPVEGGRRRSTYLKSLPWLALTPGPLVAPMLVAGLGATAALVFVAGMGGIGLLAGNPLGYAALGALLLVYLAYFLAFPSVLALGVSVAVGLVGLGVGVGGFLYFFFPVPPHSYVPFVRRYNARLLKKHRLQTSDVPPGFFP